jgi:hypothetical protein
MNNAISTATKRTEPFVSESLAEIFNQVLTVCIPKGLYYFRAFMSWDDAEAFDQETVEEIEAARWRYRGAGFDPEIKYLRSDRWCMMFTNQSSLFRGQHTGDIRERPLSFCGYTISCEQHAGRGGYKGSVAYGTDYIAHRTEKAKRFAGRESVSEVANDIRSLLEVHTPEVHKQVEAVLDAVNRVRKAAGLELVTPAQAGLADAAVLTLAPE